MYLPFAPADPNPPPPPNIIDRPSTRTVFSECESGITAEPLPHVEDMEWGGDGRVRSLKPAIIRLR